MNVRVKVDSKVDRGRADGDSAVPQLLLRVRQGVGARSAFCDGLARAPDSRVGVRGPGVGLKAGKGMVVFPLHSSSTIEVWLFRREITHPCR